MPFVGLGMLLSILMVVHIIQTGRDRTWLMVAFVPGIGPIAYFLAEILPDLLNTRRGRDLAARTEQLINPDRALREATEALEKADTPHNRFQMGEALLGGGRAEDALGVFQKLLAASDGQSLHLHLAVIRAASAAGKHTVVLDAVAALRQALPESYDRHAHRLMVVALMELGRRQDALEELERLIPNWPGEECRAMKAQVLEAMGRPASAQDVWREILERARRSPAGYRKQEAVWIWRAEQALGERSRS